MLQIKTTPTPYWTKAIEEARKCGYFTFEDVQKAKHWTTCACGKQDIRIPRVGVGAEPRDPKLAQLGAVFYEAVGFDDALLAETLLERIELRSAQILLEQGV